MRTDALCSACLPPEFLRFRHSAYAQAALHAQAPSAQRRSLIRGAAIIDGFADAPLRDRSLLIEGNTSASAAG